MNDRFPGGLSPRALEARLRDLYNQVKKLQGNEKETGRQIRRIRSRLGDSGDAGADRPTGDRPPNPIGLTGNFVGKDAIFNWTSPDIADLKGFDVEMSVSDSEVREERVNGNGYVYSFDKNVADNGFPAAATLTATVYAVNLAGNRSLGTSLTLTNEAPAAPTGLVLASTLSQITVEVAEPQFNDYFQTVVKAGLTAVEGDASQVYAGTAHQGIQFPILGDGTNYVWVYFQDQFGLLSSAVSGSTTADLITSTDMQGSIFQIQPSSDPAPASGSLDTDLWDGDTATGCFFGTAPTIEFEFPGMNLFDMVRFYVGTPRNFYVQVYDADTATWVDVLGSAASPQASVASAWNVKRFDGNLRYAAKRIRIVFSGSMTLYELKFGTVVLADEMLAQNLTVTSSMQVVSESGGTIINENGLFTNVVDTEQLVVGAAAAHKVGSVATTTADTTTSTSYVDVPSTSLTITLDEEALVIVRLVAQVQATDTDSDSNAMTKVTLNVDGTDYVVGGAGLSAAQQATEQQFGQAVGTNNAFIVVGGVTCELHETMAAGVHTIKARFKSASAGNSAGIVNRKMTVLVLKRALEV